MRVTKASLKDLVYKVTGAAIEVHRALGPGLLESVYHNCLAHEFGLKKISFQSEMNIPVDYKGKEVSANLRCDFYIENILVLEIKAATEVHSIYEAQLLTYMKLLKAPQGLLINFNVLNIWNEGQKTYVNEYYRTVPKE